MALLAISLGWWEVRRREPGDEPFPVEAMVEIADWWDLLNLVKRWRMVSHGMKSANHRRVGWSESGRWVWPWKLVTWHPKDWRDSYTCPKD